MNRNLKLYTAVGVLSALFMFPGCGKKVEVAPMQKVKAERSQELVITTDVKKKPAKEKTRYQYNVKLDNVTNTKAELILKNKGDKPLKISSIKLINEAGNNGLIKTSNNCGKTILGGSSCKLNVEFIGEEEGRYASVIQIKSNDRRNKVTNILVTAIGQDKYHARVNKVNLKPQTAKKTVELKFNALNRTQYIQIENDGLGVLKFNPPKRSGADADSFSYTTTCKRSLEVGEKCSIAVTYDPTKKEGYSDAVIKIPSNGNITPSRYIRLEGYSKPFTIKLTNFVVSKNVADFVDDYFASNKTYYVRTIYQSKTDRFFTTGISKEIKSYFKANGFKLARSASSADKIITIYPTVTVTKNEQTNDVQYNIVINGHLTTKAKNLKVDDNKNLAVSYDSNVTQTQFTAISLNDLVFDKRKFQYGLTVQVDNVADEKEVASTVADITVSKLFNVLGLQDTKDNN